MKNKLIGFICLGFVLSFGSSIQAGDLYVGLRGWQASWSPGVIRKIENDAGTDSLLQQALGNRAIVTVPYAADNVSGFYQGPLVSYITDDKKWSFSLVGLAGKSGRQGFTRTLQEDSRELTQIVLESVQTRPTRTDLDFTAGYEVIKRVKVFVGWKRQSYEFKIDASLQGSAGFQLANNDSYKTPLYGFGEFNIKHAYSGPAVGIAYGLPLSATASLTFSLGYFSARGQSNETYLFLVGNGRSAPSELTDLSYSEINTPISISGITYEVTYTGAITKKVFLQLGLRGQRTRIRIGGGMEDVSLSYTVDNDGEEKEFAPFPYPGEKYVDKFSGLTFSVIYKL